MVQEVLEVQQGQSWSKLNHISKLILAVLVALVVQEGQLVPVCHNLGYLVHLVPQEAPETRSQTLLLVPQVLVFLGSLVARGSLPVLCLLSLLSVPGLLWSPSRVWEGTRLEVQEVREDLAPLFLLSVQFDSFLLRWFHQD